MMMDAGIGTAQAGEVLLSSVGAGTVKAVRLS